MVKMGCNYLSFDMLWSCSLFSWKIYSTEKEVVTNEDRVNGAATMFYPGVMDEIGEKLKGNFFVLPSSLHETIVVPNDGNMEYKALLAMVTEINATQVDTQDKLTDQVYHYDVTDKVFEKAFRYEDRKQEKEKSHEKKSVLEKREER